jgi:tRNA-modifying protein YgfZ
MMPTAYLADRSFVRISGEEALPWLHNIVTSDMSHLEPGQGRYGALLSPQGKILFDFIASLGRVDHDPGKPPAVYLETVGAAAPDFARRLGLYKLRAKVRIEDLSQQGEHGRPVAVAVAWGDTRAYQGDAVRVVDPRHPDLGERMATYEEDAIAVATGDPIAWQAHRLTLGVPEAGKDFDLGDAFPHEALLDMLGGLDFRKGCYIGQEVVSRMEHRGTARTRLVPVGFDGDGPPRGTAVTIGAKPAGTMGSGIEGHGLAMLRLDRVAEGFAAGEALAAADVPLGLVRPAFWRGAFPDGGGAAGGGVSGSFSG